jgi:hypothetical protein
LNKASILVVISYFDKRPLKHLNFLLETLKKFDAGCSFDICIVINRTNSSKIAFEGELKDIKILERPNVGMNIGAWDHAWRVFNNYKHYLFLQDECYIVRKNWLTAFKKKINSDKSIGMLGESFNYSWAQSWDKLRIMNANIYMPEHQIHSKKVNRVDVYIDFMRRNKISPQKDGGHLRSLVWFISLDTLKKIDGFPLGIDYGQCIGSEISVSKKIESIGLKVVQLKKTAFYYIRHIEWSQNIIGGPFTHKRAPDNEILKMWHSRNLHMVAVIRDKLKNLLARILTITR